MFESLRVAGFQLEFHSHAEAILGVDFPEVADQLERILLASTIPIKEIVGSGGGETKGTQRLRRALQQHGWRKHRFEVKRTIDGVQRESVSHEVDHISRFAAGTVALEIEWNNKDPFFDRDLENYRRLHADGAISIGILITRGITMQHRMRDLVLRFATEERLDSLKDLKRIGLAATTHWRKLEDRIRRGVGNSCPLLLIGLPASLVTFGEAAAAAAVVDTLIEEGERSLFDR